MDTENRFWELPKKLIVQNTTSDIIARLEKEPKRIACEELESLIAFAFIALHGKCGEDGCLQGPLELLGTPIPAPGSWPRLSGWTNI